MNTAADNEAAEVQRGHFNPYQLDPAHVLEPPTRIGDILRQIGPGSRSASLGLFAAAE